MKKPTDEVGRNKALRRVEQGPNYASKEQKSTCQISTAGTASANLFPNTVCDQPCRFPITYSRRFARVTATLMIFGQLPAQLLAPGVLAPRTKTADSHSLP